MGGSCIFLINSVGCVLQFWVVRYRYCVTVFLKERSLIFFAHCVPESLALANFWGTNKFESLKTGAQERRSAGTQNRGTPQALLITNRKIYIINKT